MHDLGKLADRSYKTYKARLFAAERLQSRNRAWNACLLSLSVATTLASVALLTDQEMYGRAGPTILVCVAVLALVASLVVSALNYGGRSRDMFMNYRRIQKLSVEAEGLIIGEAASAEDIDQLAERYESLLDDSENHTTSDYIRAVPDNSQGLVKWPVVRAVLLTQVPYLALIFPILVVLPIVEWVIKVGR